MSEERYDILGNELIMYPDGAGVRGEVTVNGIVYRVHQNVSWGSAYINDKLICPMYLNFAFGVSSVIAKQQNYTAWQQAKLGIWDFETVIVSAEKYRVCDVVFYVYRSVDNTCWRYVTDGDDRCHHASRWFNGMDFKPCLHHFRHWVNASISNRVDDEKNI